MQNLSLTCIVLVESCRNMQRENKNEKKRKKIELRNRRKQVAEHSNKSLILPSPAVRTKNKA